MRVWRELMEKLVVDKRRLLNLAVDEAPLIS